MQSTLPQVALAALGTALLSTSPALAGLTPAAAGSETHLGRLLFTSDLLSDANLPANRVDDAADQLYNFPSTAVTTLIIEIAGHKNANDFGIYDPLATDLKGSQLVVFDGPETRDLPSSPTVTKTITFDALNKKVTVNGVTKTFQSTQFGFFLGYDSGANDQSYAYTLYSEPARNSSAIGADALKTSRPRTAESQGDRLVTFSNWTETTINGVQVRANGSKVFDRILAWEDLETGSDYDYNDMVLGLSMTVVPEPTTVVAGTLLGLPALIGLLRAGRRRQGA